MSTHAGKEHLDHSRAESEVPSLTDRIEHLKKRIGTYRESLASDDCLVPAQVWRQLKHDTNRLAAKSRKHVTTQQKPVEPVSRRDRLELFTEQLRSITRSPSGLHGSAHHDTRDADNGNADDEIRMEFRHRAPITSNFSDLNLSLTLKEAWSPIDLRSLSCLLVAGPDLHDVLRSWGRLAEIQQCQKGPEALRLVQQRRQCSEQSRSGVLSSMFDIVFVSSTLPDRDLSASALVKQLRAERYFGFVVVFIPPEGVDSNPTARPFQGTEAVLVLQSQLS